MNNPEPNYRNDETENETKKPLLLIRKPVNSFEFCSWFKGIWVFWINWIDVNTSYNKYLP